MSEKNINSRIQHKYDVEANWLKATNFVPKAGELIVYDTDSKNHYPRLKIGNGKLAISALPFTTDKNYEEQIFNTYLLDINYDNSLGFNKNEIVIGLEYSAMLGQGMLGKIILG